MRKVSLCYTPLHSLHIVFRKTVGEAALSLEWSCGSCKIVRQLVPETSLFHSAMRLANFPKQVLIWAPPSAPEAFYRHSAISKQVELKWAPPLDDGGLPITNVKIYRALTRMGTNSTTPTGALNFEKVFSGPPNIHTWTDPDPNLRESDVYRYALISTNSYASSEPYEILVQPSVRPTKPVVPQLQAGGDGKLTLLLRPPSRQIGRREADVSSSTTPVRFYELRRNTGVLGETPDIAVQGAMPLVYDDSGTVERGTDYKNVTLYGLEANKTYAFRVRFASRVGWSPFSDVVLAKCCYFTPPLDTPKTLRRHPDLRQDDTTISLLWDAVLRNGSTALISYRVYEEYDVVVDDTGMLCSYGRDSPFKIILLTGVVRCLLCPSRQYVVCRRCARHTDVTDIVLSGCALSLVWVSCVGPCALRVVGAFCSPHEEIGGFELRVFGHKLKEN